MLVLGINETIIGQKSGPTLQFCEEILTLHGTNTVLTFAYLGWHDASQDDYRLHLCFHWNRWELVEFILDVIFCSNFLVSMLKLAWLVLMSVVQVKGWFKMIKEEFNSDSRNYCVDDFHTFYWKETIRWICSHELQFLEMKSLFLLIVLFYSFSTDMK